MEQGNADLIAVRENPETEVGLTHSQRTFVDAGSYQGQLSVEYKPRALLLESDALETFVYVMTEELISPEKLIAEVYRSVAGATFPKEHRGDAPSEYVPLVVDFEYLTDGTDVTQSIHIGQFR